MNSPKSTRMKHGHAASGLAGIVCVMTAVFLFVSCEQPGGSGPERPVITITAQPDDRTVVEGAILGTDVLSVSASVTEGKALSYQWYSNTSASDSGGTAVPNGTGKSFSIPATLTAGTYYYYCVVSATGGAASVSSDVATLTVNPPDTPSAPKITINTHPKDHTVIENSISGNLSVAASVTESAVLSYQWYYNTSYNNSGGTAESNATGATFTIPTTLAVGKYYYYCEVSATDADTKRSAVALVKVNPIGTPPVPEITIDTHPVDREAVQGSISGSLSVTASVTPQAALSYQWYYNTSASYSGGTAASNGTDAAFTIPTTLTEGTHYYYCEVSAADADTKLSAVAIVKVNPSPVITINTHPVDREVMEDYTSINLSVSASVTPGAVLSYQWYYNTSGNNSGWTQAEDATSASITIPKGVVPRGTYYFYCEVSADGADSVRSNVVTVRVNRKGSGPAITITKQPTATTTFTEDSISGSLSVTASVTPQGTLYYQWYHNTSNSPIGGTFIPGESDATYTIPTTLPVGTHYYYCEVTAWNAVSVYSNVAVVTVNPPGTPPPPVITINTQPAPYTTATQGSISESLNVEASITPDAVLNYKWYENNSPINSGGTAVPDAISVSFTIPTYLIEGTYYYYCEVTAEGADPVYSNVAVVTVNPPDTPIPVINITTQPEATITLTEGSISGSLNVEANVTDGSMPNYQWYRNTVNSNEGGITVSGATNATFSIPTTLAAGTYYYYCEVTAEGAVPVYSDAAIVTVSPPVPLINITTQPEATTAVTAGKITGSLSVVASVTEGATLTYQWYKNMEKSNSGGMAEPSATNATFPIPTTLAAGTYYYYCVVTAEDAVPVSSDAATVTVSELGDLEIIIQLYSGADPDLIQQSAYTAPGAEITFTVSGTNYSNYKWYVDGAAEAGAASASYTFNESAGDYDLTVVVTDADNETWSGSCWVTVR